MVKCVHDGEVARDVLEYCRRDTQNKEQTKPRYAIVSTPQTRLVIRTSPRTHAVGEDVFIHPDTTNAPPDHADVEIKAATEWQFFRYRFWYDRRRKLALGGFLLAVLGSIVDALVLLGDKGMGVATAAWWIDTMRIFAVFAKPIGLFVVFYEGLLKE